MSLLSQLISITERSHKRVGRGYGSGKGGHTSGRGNKGQRARTGGGAPLWFEGGQLPITKRMPMLRGKGRMKVVRPTAEVTLSELDEMKAKNISLETLKIEKVIDKRFRKAKVIATGKLSRKIKLEGELIATTKQAKEKIEKAGGVVATR